MHFYFCSTGIDKFLVEEARGYSGGSTFEFQSSYLLTV